MIGTRDGARGPRVHARLGERRARPGRLQAAARRRRPARRCSSTSRAACTPSSAPAATRHTPCIFEYVYFARPDSIIDNISVYKARLRMGELLAEKIQRERPDHDIDVVIPIPDTSRTSALQVAQLLGVKYREGFIKNRYIGRTFIMPGQEQRSKSVRSKLNAIDLEFRGKNVLLVDDSIVRGTTSAQIIEVAREAGAKKVYFASAAPPVRYPNVYGIDMPAASELVAAGRTEEEVARIIGADWLIYQDLDGPRARRAAPRCRGHRVRHLLLLRRVRHRRRHAGVPRAPAGGALRRRQGRSGMPPAPAAVRSRSSAAPDRRRPVTLKVLIVSDRPDFRQLLAHHVTLEWPDALPAEYEPATRGPPAARASPGPPTTPCCSTRKCRAVAASSGSRTWRAPRLSADRVFRRRHRRATPARARASAGRPTCSRAASSSTSNWWRLLRAAGDATAQRPRRNLARRARAASARPLRLRADPRLPLPAAARRRRFLERVPGGVRARRASSGCSRSSARCRTWSRAARPSSASCASTSSSRTSTTRTSRRIYDIGVADDHLFLAMEYFAGRRPALAHARAAAVAHGARLPAPAGRRARRAARDRRAAPGREAGQRAAARRRQPRVHRLRSRAPARARERHHGRRRDLRHAALHEPGAGPRPAARRAQRPLQPRRRALRDADRREALRRGDAAGGDLPSRQRADSAPAGDGLAPAAAARRAARQAPDGPPGVGRGDRGARSTSCSTGPRPDGAARAELLRARHRPRVVRRSPCSGAANCCSTTPTARRRPPRRRSR